MCVRLVLIRLDQHQNTERWRVVARQRACDRVLADGARGLHTRGGGVLQIEAFRPEVAVASPHVQRNRQFQPSLNHRPNTTKASNLSPNGSFAHFLARSLLLEKSVENE